MAEILIRNIEEAVIEVLRRRAVADGTSVEEQARRVLMTAAGFGPTAAVRRLDEVRQRIAQPDGHSIVEDLRRDRHRDTLA